MPAVSIRQRRAMAIAEHHPEKLKKRNKGLLAMTGQQLHEFAATSEKNLPETTALQKERVKHLAVAKKKHWIKGAIRHPGALKRAAAKAGKSTGQFAQAHKHDSGKIGDRARLAITLMGMHR